MQEIGGIRVDVDSIGDIHTLPETLGLLDELEVKATFFVAMGPDGAGKNLFKYMRRPWALGKARPARFGFGTLARGLISPARMEDCKDELIEIKKHGHEVGLHGYDHYSWIKTGGRKAKTQVEKGRMVFEDVFDFAPKSFASPGFKVNQEILRMMGGFEYSSDFVSKEPFYPELNGEKFQTLQVPVSLKSIGEFEMEGLDEREILGKYQKAIENNGFFAFYFHPSYEVKYKSTLLRKIIENVKENKKIRPLGEIARTWNDENTPDL
jgi:peptidoglycan/xylan/chitin deacetylase (PgdA/CDA1 family)